MPSLWCFPAKAESPQRRYASWQASLPFHGKPWQKVFYVSSAEAGSNGAWLAVDFGKQAAIFARNGITYCKAFFTEMTGQFKIVRKLIFVQTFENGKDVLTFVGVQVKITVFNTAGYTF